jgi:hypothetical protein
MSEASNQGLDASGQMSDDAQVNNRPASLFLAVRRREPNEPRKEPAMPTFPTVPPAVKVEFSEPSQSCSCRTGCGRCRGSGVVRAEQQLSSVTCACGWDCTAAQWALQPSPLCPLCGVDLEAAIASQWPQEGDARDAEDSERAIGGDL